MTSLFQNSHCLGLFLPLGSERPLLQLADARGHGDVVTYWQAELELIDSCAKHIIGVSSMRNTYLYTISPCHGAASFNHIDTTQRYCILTEKMILIWKILD